MISALPDLLSSSLFSRVTADLRADLDRVSIEAVTGRRSDLTEASAGQTGQIHRAQKAVDQAQSTQTRLALIAGRFTQAAASFESIRGATESVGSNALQAASSGNMPGIATASSAASSSLAQVFSALNVRFDGRSLFAGDQGTNETLASADTINADINAIVDGAGTTADKMAAIDAYFAPGGTFDTTIYQGGTGAASAVRLPNGFELESLPTAAGSDIRDLIKGMTIVSTAIKLPPQDILAWVQQGADLIAQARDSVIQLEANNATSLNRIENAVEDERGARTVAEETLDRIIGRDAFEAASEVQNLEIRLQAAYTLTSRIGQLSLTNFLR